MVKDPTMMSNLFYLMQNSAKNNIFDGASFSDFRSLNELNIESIQSRRLMQDDSLSINGIGFSNLNIDSSSSNDIEEDSQMK